MNWKEALRTVDTVTRIARKGQLMIKDAPKVEKILGEYSLERKFKKKLNQENRVEPIEVKSRNRFKPINLNKG